MPAEARPACSQTSLSNSMRVTRLSGVQPRCVLQKNSTNCGGVHSGNPSLTNSLRPYETSWVSRHNNSRRTDRTRMSPNSSRCSPLFSPISFRTTTSRSQTLSVAQPTRRVTVFDPSRNCGVVRANEMARTSLHRLMRNYEFHSGPVVVVVIVTARRHVKRVVSQAQTANRPASRVRTSVILRRMPTRANRLVHQRHPTIRQCGNPYCSSFDEISASTSFSIQTSRCRIVLDACTVRP